MILAETQLSSKHSSIYIIAQSPSQLFTDTDLQLELSIHRSSSFPGDFSDWPPGSRIFDHCSNCLTGLIASLPAPRAIHFPHSQVIFKM